MDRLDDAPRKGCEAVYDRARPLLRNNLSFGPKARTRSFVVALEHTFRIGDRKAALVNELSDSRHLGEIDLLHRIAHAMIVRMQSGGEERDRNTLLGVAVVVAARVNAFRIVDVVQLVVER